MANSKAGVDWQQLGMAAGVLIILLAAFYFLPSLQGEKPPPAEPPEVPITQEQFEATLQGASSIAIIMDVRGGDNASKDAILQCGVNLARNMGELGKDVVSYSYGDGDICFTYEGEEMGVEACEQEFEGTYALIVSYGSASTTFYADRALISTNEYYGSACSIVPAPTPVEPEPIVISPNVTAETAVRTPEGIYATCSVYNYCSTLEPAEEASCVKSAALNIAGDPTCCFGLTNLTERDDCITSTAGNLHGVGEDYCQFVSEQWKIDVCYYNYAVGWNHYPYCEPILNSSLKAECYVEMASAGVLPGSITPSEIPTGNANTTDE